MKLYDSATSVRQLSSLEWVFALRLAQRYGWQPSGTGTPCADWRAQWPADEPWNGSYVHPEGQRMTSEDCDRLADALEKGLLEAMYKQDLYLDDDGRDAWSDLIAFCRVAASKQGLLLLADEQYLAQRNPTDDA